MSDNVERSRAICHRGASEFARAEPQEVTRRIAPNRGLGLRHAQDRAMKVVVPLSSLLSMIDDIAIVLDDVALLTKVAAKKTSGVLGDDLALNAEQVTGVRADRELPVVWAVAKGSAVNKAILVPTALGISWAAPWLVTPLLMLGGLFLCYEGVEKLVHKLLHGKKDAEARRAELAKRQTAAASDPAAFEKTRIRGAIRTDFVLSAEIIVITLGTVAAVPVGTRVAVLIAIAALMTAGVYGFVAAIVKLDDVGLYLSVRKGDAPWPRLARGLGWAILKAAPILMKALGVAGMVAMFLVGGGILAHGIPQTHHWTEALAHITASVPIVGGMLQAVVPSLANGALGVAAGLAALAVVSAAKRSYALVKPARK